MQLTIGRIIFCFILIGFAFVVSELSPAGDCSTLYSDKIKIKQCQTIQTLASIIVIMVIVSVLLMIIGSILSKSDDKPERPWNKLPKGFDKPKNGDVA